jgi:hypothetical protein
MNLVETVQTLLVPLTNRFLRDGDLSKVTSVEDQTSLALSSARSDRPTIWFVYPDREALLYPTWLAELRARGGRRLRLARIADFGETLRIPPGMTGLRQAAGFVNMHETVLALELSDHVEGIRMGLKSPPRTDLTHRDVARFIDESPEREHFREAMLWQDERNLHYADGKNWDALLAAVTPEREGFFVEMFSISVSNVAVSKATAERWYALSKAHTNKLAPTVRAWTLGTAQRTPMPASTQEASTALRGALSACETYARRMQLASWGPTFAEAIATLDGGAPPQRLDEIFADLFPTEAARLLSAISRCGGVFGAMGSWNDLGLEHDADYGTTSERLFVALNDGLLSACEQP